MVVAITGHQRLPDPAAWAWVSEAMAAVLDEVAPPLCGVSSLAIGADQLFAELILARGCELRVVLPFAAYEETFQPGRDLEGYRALLERAAAVEVLAAGGSREQSYLAAGRRVVELADQVLTVWNGLPAAGLGGTADVVLYALHRRKPVVCINPMARCVGPLRPRGPRG